MVRKELRHNRDKRRSCTHKPGVRERRWFSSETRAVRGATAAVPYQASRARSVAIGRQTRDFTFVDNVSAANLLAAEAGENVAGRVFNVGGGASISIPQPG